VKAECQDARDVFDQMKASMRKIDRVRYGVTMKDVIEDDDCISIVVSKLGSKTLSEVVGTFRKSCPAALAQTTIAKVAQMLQNLHQRGVVHRFLSQNAVGMIAHPTVPGGFKFSKVGAFDLATTEMREN